MTDDNKHGGAAFPGDGGPAFPGAELPAHPNHPTGMSLRDWFAGQALAGILSGRGPVMDRAFLAGIAYEFADGMLAARGAGE